MKTKIISYQWFSGQPFLILMMVLVLYITVGACSVREKDKRKSQDVDIELVDSDGLRRLFDGESLAGWEITPFGTQGRVTASDGKVILNFGDGCTGITWKDSFPTVNYEVILDARRTSGNDFFCGLTFPVKAQFCSLIVGGWGGPVVGLSCIDGQDASENQTKTLRKFEKDVWYNIRLQVTDSTILAWIDNKKLVDFNYNKSKLSVRPEVELSKPFGICSWVTTAELRNIVLKEL